MKAARGLVAGKFWPMQRGHVKLIDRLFRECERAYVLVCASPNQVPSGIERARWIQALFPQAEVIVDDDLCALHHPDPCKPICSETYANRVRELGLAPINVVVSAEAYGERFAKLLGAEHVALDRSQDGAITSTKIREDLAAGWKDLPDIVRVGLHRRVAVIGAESTGTSTLAADLAEELQAPLVSEYGRMLSWELFAQSGSMEGIDWHESHFWQVVDQQIRLEHDAIWANVEQPPGELGPWLVCDTDTLATVAWWERYLKTSAAALQGFAAARYADFYVLTSPEGVLFNGSDPLRDGSAVRLSMHERFLQLIRDSGRPWMLAKGSRSDRLTSIADELRRFETHFPRWVHS